MRKTLLLIVPFIVVGFWGASVTSADDCADALEKVQLTASRPPDPGTQQAFQEALDLCPSSPRLYRLVGDYYEHWSQNDINPERQAYFNYLATECYARGIKSGKGDEVTQMKFKLAALESQTEEISEVRIRSVTPYVRLNVRVFFEFNSSELNKGAQEQLDVLGRYLAEESKSRIILEGHTDLVGGEEYNLALSLKRAQSSKEYLVSKFGVMPDSIETVGHGFERLADVNDPYSAKNRRVRIRKLPF